MKLLFIGVLIAGRFDSVSPSVHRPMTYRRLRSQPADQNRDALSGPDHPIPEENPA